jgi:hypothetical protein
MVNIKNLFSKISKNEYFIRVDNKHPHEIMVGIDSKGRKALRFIGLFEIIKVKSTAEIEVNHYKLSDDRLTLVFSLINLDSENIFFKFCEDIVDFSRNINSDKNTYLTIVNRYNSWKKIFINSKSKLDDNQIQGLIGELYFLNNVLSDKIGAEDALKSWTGQELTHKDFSNSKYWYEIKTILKTKKTVKISSLEQLESENNGYLVIIKLEKMSRIANGISLNKLVKEFLLKLDKSEFVEEFLTKISMTGYQMLEEYDLDVYELDVIKFYLVDVKFPRLRKAKIPLAITKASYEIDIIGILENEVLEWKY